jgi:hypothetical protein
MSLIICAGHCFAGATVRCATRVTARIITHEQLVEYLLQQPMAKHQVRILDVCFALTAWSPCILLNHACSTRYATTCDHPLACVYLPSLDP